MHTMYPALYQLKRAEALGIEVTFGADSIRLAAKDRDRNLFSQGLILLREAEAAMPEENRAAFRASPQTIVDFHGTPHTMTVAEARALLVAYGVAYQALWTAAAQTGD